MKTKKLLSVLIASSAFVSFSVFADKAASTSANSTSNAPQNMSQQNDMNDSDYEVGEEGFAVEEVTEVGEYNANGQLVAEGEEVQEEVVEADVVEGGQNMVPQTKSTKAN
ncbi:hypothetical protein OAO18_05685 [Francisellaceae bacterium]|nr:hypothetical protein [Francisellaceae bacterium]